MDMRSLYDGMAGAASASRRHSACCSGLVASRCKIQHAVFDDVSCPAISNDTLS